MKKKPASKSAFFNPRVLTSFAFCLIGSLLALAVAFSAPKVEPPTAPGTASHPIATTDTAESRQTTAVPAISSALVTASDNGLAQNAQNPPPATHLVILYDKTSFPGTTSTSSQYSKASFGTLANQAADDFVVPAGQTWTIRLVNFQGVY